AAGGRRRGRSAPAKMKSKKRLMGLDCKPHRRREFLPGPCPPALFPLQHPLRRVRISGYRPVRGIATSRRALLRLAGLALVAFALLWPDGRLWRPGRTEDKVRRLRRGMTLAEVEELLGGPATETIDWQAEGGPLAQMGIRWQRHWRADGAAVDVQFFAD